VNPAEIVPAEPGGLETGTDSAIALIAGKWLSFRFLTLNPAFGILPANLKLAEPWQRHIPGGSGCRIVSRGIGAVTIPSTTG